MEGDAESVLRATDDACSAALGALEGRDPLGLLAFDCIARRGVLGDEGLPVEVERLRAHAAGGPVAGFYTYGEIARTSGTGGFEAVDHGGIGGRGVVAVDMHARARRGESRVA